MIIEREKYLEFIRNFPFPCVDIILLCKDKYLLVKRKEEPQKDKWWLIGGRIHKDETIRDSVIRKSKEETGLDVVPRKLIDVSESLNESGPEGINIHSINIIYLAHSHSDKVKLDDTSSEYQWIPINRHPLDLDQRLIDALQIVFGSN